MNPVTRALWFIESHFAQEITLDDIADVAGVSKYHMSRAFGLATGASVMQYVRARRLTEAARRLACGAPDILSEALEAGYGSHEAFTRAFREQFGLTPEAVRAQGHVNTMQLKEPIRMDETFLTNLAPPRFVDGKTMLIAGIGERYNSESSAAIPAQWQRFTPYLGHIPGQVGRTAYGVIGNTDDTGEMEYISGVEVADFTKVPKEWSRIRIPEQRYAVFSHDGHISSIKRVWNTIWNKWLHESGRKVAEGAELERYDENFDSATGDGGFEIWIPLKS
ncbi:MAG: AraC family transcriptional regulator [Edaphobacter sp.]|nr:AraC family transcriptional regulator [Edaphobacter sp.]